MIGFRLQSTGSHSLSEPIDHEVVAPSIPRQGETVFYDGHPFLVKFVVHNLDANPPEVQVRI